MGTQVNTKIIVCMTDVVYATESGVRRSTIPPAPIVGGRVRGYSKPTPIQSTIPAEQETGAKRQKSKESSYEFDPCRPDFEGETGADGCITFVVPAGCYSIHCEAFGLETCCDEIKAEPGCTKEVKCEVPVGFQPASFVVKEDCKDPVPCMEATEGAVWVLRATHQLDQVCLERKPIRYHWATSNGRILESFDKRDVDEVHLDTTGFVGDLTVTATLSEKGSAHITRSFALRSNPQRTQKIAGDVNVSMTRTETDLTDDLPLWVVIRNSTEALSFNNYLRFMDWLFCGKDDRASLKDFERERFTDKLSTYAQLRNTRFLPFTDGDAYRVVKAATEAFVIVNCGIVGEPNGNTQPFDRDLDEAYFDRRDIPVPGKGLREVFNEDYLESVDGTSTLPYLAIIRRKLPDVPIKTTLFEDAAPGGAADECFGLLQDKLRNPCLLELIWSYWHEEGMLVQTVNAITRRFQNVRAPTPQDPVSNLEMDPLRPLNNLFWGYIQDEQHRLTVGRRNYEYDHHYGLRLEGRAVQNFRLVDTRSKFLEALHHLLRLCTVFYKQDDDTTVKADAFPVLNALKETHLILSQGAHNQFGDLPSTARIEMLMQEWLLARPEFREFLPTRIMVAYPEPWMDRVDAMKKLQGWTDTSVLHFRNLGMFGEQILLSIRWGAWSDVQEPIQAFNWARFFRPQVQGYIHAYRAATGVDLATETVDTRVDSTLPSVLLKRRLAMEKQAS